MTPTRRHTSREVPGCEKFRGSRRKGELFRLHEEPVPLRARQTGLFEETRQLLDAGGRVLDGVERPDPVLIAELFRGRQAKEADGLGAHDGDGDREDLQRAAAGADHELACGVLVRFDHTGTSRLVSIPSGSCCYVYIPSWKPRKGGV